ncbi:hypothetical protein [Helicobacter fennelliae]|uniref:Uncharacterized protein n=1 Tax=Helicobacter fennelliae MRY12-0050 TaxID=1325130 RepID=T1DWI5_9HELI|nr:hypothetical protein [Helicobacter fennelliae]GAD19432.1 hypothetical protein HFN_0563 [Helicobacter fennelliae MRY12-0050]
MDSSLALKNDRLDSSFTGLPRLPSGSLAMTTKIDSMKTKRACKKF